MTDAAKPKSQFFAKLDENVTQEGKWIKGALKTAGEHLNPFTEGQPRKVAGFGRIAGVGVGSVMVLDGLFRGKTNNGEDRSVITRFGEVALGVAGIGLCALAGGRGAVR